MKVLDTTCSISSTSSYIQIEHKAATTADTLEQMLRIAKYDRVVLCSALLRADTETVEVHKEMLAVCNAHNVIVSYA